MTISLLLAHSERGGTSSSQLTPTSVEGGDGSMNQSSNPSKKAKITGFEKLLQQRNTLASGGNLIICPMTLLGQWKVLISLSFSCNKLLAQTSRLQSVPCIMLRKMVYHI